MRLKYAIKSIKKHKFFRVILVLQLICIFIPLYNILFYNNEVNKLVEKLNRYYYNRSFYRFVYDEPGNVLDVGGKEKLMKLFKGLEDSKEFKFAVTCPSDLFVEKFDAPKEALYEGGMQAEFGIKGEGIFINSLVVTKSTLSIFNVRLESGRYFNEDEYYEIGDNKLPIIVGNNYKDIYNVGDIIHYSNFNTGEIYDARVVGILEKGESIPIKFDKSNAEAAADINSNNYNLDSVMIIPISENNIIYDSAHLFNLIYYNFFVFDSDMDHNEKENILANIENKIETETGSHYSRKSFDKEITAEINKYKEIRKNYEITSYITIVFSTITIIVSIINSINSRKKEFGVYLFCGGKIKDIIAIILYEMIIISIISLVISAILIKLYLMFFKTMGVGGMKISNLNIDLKIIAILFAVGIIYSIITSIIPIRKVSKLSINNLLRRDD